MRPNIILDNYFNELQIEYDHNILEGKIHDKITSQFKQILSKFKTGGKYKPEINKKTKEIQKSENYKKVYLAIQKSTKNGKLDESRLKKELSELCDYTTANFFTLLISVFYIQLYRKNPGVIYQISYLSTIIANLMAFSEPIIVKLISRTENKILDIQKGMVEKTHPIKFLIAFLVLPLLISVLASLLSGQIMVGVILGSITTSLIALTKFIYSIYIGTKLNSWKYYEKQIKQKFIVESIYISEYVDTLIFISSLRENLISNVSTLEAKDFILNKASDYEILYFVIEGKFPKCNDENYEDLLEILNIGLNMDFKPIFEFHISTKGFTAGILLETILSDFTSTQLLMEINVNTNKLSDLEKLMKLAKKNMANAMKNNLQNDNEKTKTAYTNAGTAFNNAKERYKQYKSTGTDPGKKAFSSPDGGNIHNSWTEFINKIFNVSPSSYVKNILSKTYGASKLSKAANINQPLAGFLITLSAAVLTSVFIFASYKAYQRLLGTAAKFCRKEKPGKNTVKCMKKFELKGVKERIIDLKKVISFCDKLKKSERKVCVITIQSKINSLNKELKNIQTFLNAN